MATNGQPCYRLRPKLAVAPNGTVDSIVLYDPNRITPSILTLSRQHFEVIRLFTGTRTILQLQSEIAQLGLGMITAEEVTSLANKLDDALFLDSVRSQDYVLGPTRLPSCIGCYPSEPDAIRATLEKLFTAPGGPGRPNLNQPRSADRHLRAALLPHMDYTRGGITYGWGFKELVEQTDATTFVIIATSHYSSKRYTLTRKNFTTPLGIVETNQQFIDTLVTSFGDGLFDDPFAHLPEHSIELEVLLLQYLYETQRSFRIVPLLCGSFYDCTHWDRSPRDQRDIMRMVEALRSAEASTDEKICYLISGDLAHIGPKFGDNEPVQSEILQQSHHRDQQILDALTTANPGQYFEVIAGEKDARRICGLPPTWLTLAATTPKSGEVLHYQQYVHPTGQESVSFAAALFYD